MSAVPRVVAVDLTPLLPGGDNGGAKVFAMELVRALARVAPADRFVLLTQASTHEELAPLDAPNVRRECVLGAGAERSRSGLAARWEAAMRLLPGAFAGAFSRIAYAAHRAAKRRAGLATVRRVAPDLLFAPFTAPTYALPRVPVVSVVHDVQHRALPRYFTPAERAFRESAVREALARATRIAAVSAFTARALGAAVAARVQVVPERLAARLPVAAAGAALPPGVAKGRYFLYAANTWPHKNHVALVDAFAVARGRGLPGDYRLVLTGAAASGEGALRAAIERHGLQAAVIRAGYVATEALATLLRDARAVIFPSLYEGFGIPVIEAMAAGVPVACSNTTALPEVAGEAALMFDPASPAAMAEAMLRLAADDALCASLRERGIAQARPYEDADLMARDYLRLFTEALASR